MGFQERKDTSCHINITKVLNVLNNIHFFLQLKKGLTQKQKLAGNFLDKMICCSNNNDLLQQQQQLCFIGQKYPFHNLGESRGRGVLQT